jgi:hypothetical protein
VRWVATARRSESAVYDQQERSTARVITVRTKLVLDVITACIDLSHL